ncbi:hypothetical protein QBC40DRAFT_278797 [Triangularia verruculosa]|uniref:K Homology domain-containing protein n=1 Tax=Triangularia verruculosa TaxID=2587418 RepID=A0AAN6XHY0_9PEZI|nr:hypothetical protein QBC40DRAFT_278797 [Triangularia verruculosa]
MADNVTAEPSAASQLLQQHAAHHVMVEDVPDEELPPKSAASNEASTTESAPPAAAPKPAKAASIATQSRELFPELGTAPAPVARPTGIWAKRTGANGTSESNGTPPTSAPPSGAATPTPLAVRGPASISIPGRNVEYTLLEPQHVLPRAQLKKPLPDIAKDFNRRSRAPIKVSTMADGKVRVEATGAQDIATQALKDFINQIGTKLTIKVPIPRSTRAHVIGKGGSTIKALQEKTGARIQMPRVEDAPAAPDDEDDDSTIDVLIEGNSQQAAAARNAILKIANERAANVNTRLKGIPAEFFPFIAKNGLVGSLEQGRDLQVQVPSHPVRVAHPPVAPQGGQPPVFYPAADNFIQLTGERDAVRAAKEQIERRAEELRRQLAVDQFSLNKGRHQFIVGDKGIPQDQFFDQTGCIVVLPTDDDDETVTIIGPSDKITPASDVAMDLAMNMQSSNLDITRYFRQVPSAAAHARNVTRYLRERKEIERLEKLHHVHFNTPFNASGALPWELYARDGKNAIRASNEVKGIVEGHPPARITTAAVDPFFHAYLQKEARPKVRQDYGVHLVIPQGSEADAPLLLVYEGRTSPDSYEIPRAQPSQADLLEMQKWLNEAQTYITGLIAKQDPLTAATMDVPTKFHEKLRRFIKKEQENRPENQIPVRVSNTGSLINFRGPSSAVESLVAKCQAFIEQEKEDEKERGFILEFEFPQKFANHLIGKGGSNIRELRDKFDVDIQVNDGKVQLKGPKAKAEAARAHISALGRQLQDEATHVLKIEPKFHRELIGAQGAQINRLQTRYKVIINFPRTAKPAKDDESVADSSDAGKPRRQQASDEVIVRGPKRGADEARDEILSLLQYLKDNSFIDTITFQQKQLPSLIGSGGAVLEQLRTSTGARIDIPSAKEDGEAEVEIQIKGTKAQVAAAKKALQEKKVVFDDTVVKTIDVDRKYHKALIGTGGANLRDIVVNAGGSDDRRELARAIQFPKQDTDGNTIKVEGRTEVVDKIISQIQAIVSERESQVTDVLEVPVEKHRSLIGRGGDIKRGLENQFKVSIDIPRQGSGQTGVKIVGQAPDVEKAKTHIESLVKEQPGETVQVPRALHHAISNNGQIFRKFRNDFGVTVDHAGQAVPPRPAAPDARSNGALPLITDDEETTADAHSWKVVEGASSEEGEIPWVLRGSAESIEKAKKAIETALEQAKKQDATGYLILPDPRTYRFVIGQGGSKVNSIRKQSGCKITVPRDQAKGEAIEVVGTKEGVEKAKDLILAAVKEGIASRSAPREQ